jgi:hypothetical protein
MQSGGLGPFGVTRDGKKFLINGTSDDENSAPLTLVTNWPALLKK